jgi:hypothetical protein
MEQYGYIYKTILPYGAFEKDGNPYYIGQKKSKKILDTYYGSGKLLWRWLKSNGIKYRRNMTKKKAENLGLKIEILAIAYSEQELKKLEEKFISNLYLTDPLCINLVRGGRWGRPNSEERKIADKKQAEKMIGRHWWHKNDEEIFSLECPNGFELGRSPRMKSHIQKISANMLGKHFKMSDEGKENIRKNKNKFYSTVSKEWKEKDLERKKLLFLGNHWYTNGIIEKFCKDCPEGFHLGRIKLTNKENKI